MHAKLGAAAGIILALLSPSQTPEQAARDRLAREMQVMRDFNQLYPSEPGENYIAVSPRVLRELSPKWQSRLPEGAPGLD